MISNQDADLPILYSAAIPLIDSSWAYQYSAKDQIFYQHAASAELLKTFQQANEAVLKKVKVGDKTLSQIVKDGLAMRDNQAAGLQLVLDALASQTTQPVLLAVDSAQALYRPSRYLSPDPTPYLLDSTALSVPRALLRFASGEQSFKSGAVLLASSASNAYPSSAVDVALGQQQPAAYQARDAKYENLLKSMKAQKVPASMGLTEAAGLAELLKASKRMRSGAVALTETFSRFSSVSQLMLAFPNATQISTTGRSLNNMSPPTAISGLS